MTGREKRMWELLLYAVNRWPEFDDPDAPVNGNDMVGWFGEWRFEVKAALNDLDNQRVTEALRAELRIKEVPNIVQFAVPPGYKVIVTIEPQP